MTSELDMLNQQITAAIKALIRRGNGEFHGYIPDVAEKIACAVNGSPDDYIVKQFENHLRHMGLKWFYDGHPDIDCFRDPLGELNFIDRKYCDMVTQRGY